MAKGKVQASWKGGSKAPFPPLGSKVKVADSQEFKDFTNFNDKLLLASSRGIQIALNEGVKRSKEVVNVTTATAYFRGPEGSAYDRLFKLRIDLPDDYPLDPPSAMQITPPIQHPNFFEDGTTVPPVDLLAPDKRFPNKMTVDHVAIAIRDTLEIPHVGSARPEELAIMNGDPEAYAETARAMLLSHPVDHSIQVRYDQLKERYDRLIQRFGLPGAPPVGEQVAVKNSWSQEEIDAMDKGLQQMKDRVQEVIDQETGSGQPKPESKSKVKSKPQTA